MPMYGNGFHVPNDPTRSAALSMLQKSPGAQPGAAPAMAAPLGGSGRFAKALAMATEALTAEGMTPENQAALQQFVALLEQIAAPFTGGGQPGASPPPIGFGSLPRQSAQAAVPTRGPLP